MPSFWAGLTGLPLPRRIHSLLTKLVDEACATLARLFVYAGALALLGILGLHGIRQLQMLGGLEPDGKPGWAVAGWSYPAFAVSVEQLDKSRTYTILRHPEGGRKDVFRWPGPTGQPATELEIYRPGREPVSELTASLSERMPARGAGDLETVGVIDSKFGSVTLLHRAGSEDGMAGCLGFVRLIDDPTLQISGWSCAGNNFAARRMIIGCMLDRLTLLASADDPELVELFAQAELRRGACASSPRTDRSADWVSRTEPPRLHGAL